jgi:alpha-tubulin suppressor-like RCC1 family protein
MIQVSAGMHHTLALELNGNLYSFGRADYGQLGNTDEQPKAGDIAELPVPVYLDKDKANPIISHISSGNHMNFVLRVGEMCIAGYPV